MPEPGPTVRDVQEVYERSFQNGVVAGLMGVLRARDDEIARLEAEVQRLQAVEREALRVLGAVIYYQSSGQAVLSEAALHDDYTVERSPDHAAAGVRFKAWPTSRHEK